MSLRERAYLTYLAHSTKPILVGPWRSEVGFEVLYWLPWLRWFQKHYQIPKERLIVIARGGSGVWYDAAQHVDLYDYAPLDRLRKAMLRDAQDHGSIKQNRVTVWERKLLAVIADDLGLRRYHLLHPSWMYHGLSGWWGGTDGANRALRGLAFDAIPVPHPPLSLPLPERFVAVRFYARHTWPLTDELKVWMADLVDRLAKKLPVVVLNSPFHTDDHLDMAFEGPNIIPLAPHLSLTTNLAAQSAVVAKAQAFVGTYGGTMQLAVRLRKPAAGFYASLDGTAYAHVELTHRLGVMQGTPVFIGKPDDGKFVEEVFA